MQKKIMNHYEETGQIKEADLQRQSLESTISAIEQRTIPRNQSCEEKEQERKSFTLAPSSDVIIKILYAVTFALVGGAIFYKYLKDLRDPQM